MSDRQGPAGIARPGDFNPLDGYDEDEAAEVEAKRAEALEEVRSLIRRGDFDGARRELEPWLPVREEKEHHLAAIDTAGPGRGVHMLRHPRPLLAEADGKIDEAPAWKPFWRRVERIGAGLVVIDPAFGFLDLDSPARSELAAAHG